VAWRSLPRVEVQSADVSALPGALPPPSVSLASQQSPSFTELMWSAAVSQSPSWISWSKLMAMAFDRYVAICDPLRYTTILTNSRVIQMGLLVIIRRVLLIVPLLLLLTSLSFCKMNTLSHSYCYYPDVIKLACSDTRANSIWIS
jgi:hypothetical protein